MPDSGTIEVQGLRAVYGTLAGTRAGHNQDAALLGVAPGGLVCAVADGVGSTPGAAAAARAAVETTLAAYLAGAGQGAEQALRAAVEAAHHAVRAATDDGTGAAYGATTIVVAVVRGLRLHVASAGDSRAYAIAPDGRLDQITTDHSWVEEQVRAGALEQSRAAAHPWRSVITRYLGGETAPEVDLFDRILNPGSGVLLCSDGLMAVLSEDEVASAIAFQDPAAAVDALLTLARERQAYDDVTVCIAQLRPASGGDSR